jgi:hypothetical protein
MDDSGQGAHGSDPLGTLQRVAADVWLVDGPVERMAFPLGIRIPFPTRMTIVRLSGGDLWIHSPTRLTPALRAEIDTLGPVRHLLAPNFLHYAAIPEWAAAFPDATSWASPGVRERAASQGIAVRFDADLGDSAEAAWAQDIDQLLFAGSRFLREIVFFHRPSRTLVLADLVMNFEPDAIPAPWRWLVRLGGATTPGGTPLDVRLTFWRGRAEARRCLARILAWQPERIVISHGRWYPTNGVGELRRAFGWLG